MPRDTSKKPTGNTNASFEDSKDEFIRLIQLGVFSASAITFNLTTAFRIVWLKHALPSVPLLFALNYAILKTKNHVTPNLLRSSKFKDEKEFELAIKQVSEEIQFPSLFLQVLTLSLLFYKQSDNIARETQNPTQPLFLGNLLTLMFIQLFPYFFSITRDFKKKLEHSF